jgi:hypothetical protein
LGEGGSNNDEVNANNKEKSNNMRDYDDNYYHTAADIDSLLNKSNGYRKGEAPQTILSIPLGLLQIISTALSPHQQLTTQNNRETTQSKKSQA